ncbi:Uncharacterised protein [uncultured archaeon]|nr:Uncharacterised protein [uncultured archaeon]
MAERKDRRIERERRENAARDRASDAVDRDEVRAALKAAGAREVDDEAVEAVRALVVEKLARIAARSVEASEDIDDSSTLSAAAVAVATERDSDTRRATESR